MQELLSNLFKITKSLYAFLILSNRVTDLANLTTINIRAVIFTNWVKSDQTRIPNREILAPTADALPTALSWTNSGWHTIDSETLLIMKSYLSLWINYTTILIRYQTRFHNHYGFWLNCVSSRFVLDCWAVRTFAAAAWRSCLASWSGLISPIFKKITTRVISYPVFTEFYYLQLI